MPGCRPGQRVPPDPAVPTLLDEDQVHHIVQLKLAAQSMPLSTALPNPASLPFHPAR